MNALWLFGGLVGFGLALVLGAAVGIWNCSRTNNCCPKYRARQVRSEFRQLNRSLR
jgi:hypothetical protein